MLPKGCMYGEGMQPKGYVYASEREANGKRQEVRIKIQSVEAGFRLVGDITRIGEI